MAAPEMDLREERRSEDTLQTCSGFEDDAAKNCREQGTAG
jgi:hypothetical protein